jgi:trans-aconitate methyltransferase
MEEVQENIVFIRSVKEKGTDFYARMPAELNDNARAIFYPLFREVVNDILLHGSSSVLEVGCGSGVLAEMVMQKSKASYRGFDFSEVAIQNACSHTGHPEAFLVGDTSPFKSAEHVLIFGLASWLKCHMLCDQ